MTFEEFQQFATEYNVIPVSKTLLADTLTPVSAYLKLRGDSKESFLFESVEGGEQLARYSFIGFKPALSIRAHGSVTSVTEGGEVNATNENFFEVVRGTLARFRHPVVAGLPRFTGGLVGYLGYDSIRFIEKIPERHPDEAGIDDSMLALFSNIIAFDHIRHQITIIVNAIVRPNAGVQEEFERAQTELGRIESLLNAPLELPKPFRLGNDGVRSGLARDRFEQMVLRAKEYIRNGDIFQVVLSQRFSAQYNGDIFNAYRALRCVNPSPYLYFITFGGTHLVGSSPEVLVRAEDRNAEVYPIAGTRKRGTTAEEDILLEHELLADEKELAEHIMLVDLGRNDLGRVCEIGTVEVKKLKFIVRYSHVMHIASLVSGRLPESRSCVDVVKATFPAGTVSGAPKIRAMEIIEELEPVRRGVYAGGVGYFDFSGNMDFCITIRTMFASNNTIYFQAGAGIVADSVPSSEYQETINKSYALREALRMAEGITL